MNIKIEIRHLVVAALASGLVIWLLASPRELNGNNTVYEYMSASVEKRVHFDMRICNNGACLHHTDWDCGFTIDQEKRLTGDKTYDEAVQSCLWTAIENGTAKPWDQLDRLRQVCGRQFMIFVGEPFGSKAKCERNGYRIWGQKDILVFGRKTKLYGDEDKFLR